MPLGATILSKQMVHMTVSGPDDINAMFIATGLAQVPNGRIIDNDGASPAAELSYSILLEEPRLNPGQFRRAIATAALAWINFMTTAQVGVGSGGSLGITSVDADWDDETGLIELRFELHVGAARAELETARVSFQVIILAAM
jgi:hypothetical protein